MSDIKDFDISGFITNGELKLENQKIENCRIVGAKFQNIVFVKIVNCILRDVIFQNHIKEGIFIERSTFVNCKFHDAICGDIPYAGVLRIRYSAFTDSFFEGINLHDVCQQSSIYECNFWNCIFRNIKINGDVETRSSFFSGGEMEGISYIGCSIEECKFYNMQMRDMDIGTAARYNRLENITLKNVALMGKNERNTFSDCDTNGFAFTEDHRW